MTNTHNPNIQQYEDIALLTFLAPSILTATFLVGNVFEYKVRLFWPEPFLHDQWIHIHGIPYQEVRQILGYSSSSTNHHHHQTLQRQQSQSQVHTTMLINTSTSNTTTATATALPAISTNSTISHDETALIAATTTTATTATLFDYCSFPSLFGNVVPTVPLEETLELQYLSQKQPVVDFVFRNGQTQSTLHHKYIWKCGQRGNCLVAILCTKPIFIDRTSTKDAELQPNRDDVKICIPRYVCKEKYHSWIVIVDAITDYEGSIEKFVNQRLNQIIIEEQLDEKTQEYSITVVDTGKVPSPVTMTYKLNLKTL
jgi:hypothetical protein